MIKTEAICQNVDLMVVQRAFSADSLDTRITSPFSTSKFRVLRRANGACGVEKEGRRYADENLRDEGESS